MPVRRKDVRLAVATEPTVATFEFDESWYADVTYPDGKVFTVGDGECLIEDDAVAMATDFIRNRQPDSVQPGGDFEITTRHPAGFRDGAHTVTVRLNAKEGTRFVMGGGFGCSRDYAVATCEEAIRWLLRENAMELVSVRRVA